MRLYYPAGSGTNGGFFLEAADYASLPAAASATNQTYLVLSSTGIWPLRKSAGFWRSNGSAWTYMGDFDPTYIKNIYESNGYSSATVDGALLHTDWITFNAKQPAGNYLTAITGDVAASGPGSASAVLATVNSNVGSFGDATHVPALTVNGKGLVTAAASTSIQIAESQVTGLVSDLSGKQATGNYITALTGDISASGPGSAAATLATVTIAKGGTGQTAKTAAFDALSPLSAGGDILYGGASGTGTRLANGTAGQILSSAGGTAAPSWISSYTPTVAGTGISQTFFAMTEDWMTGALAGQYGWTATVATGTVAMNTANIDSTHWGIVTLTSGTTSTNAALLSPGAAVRLALDANVNSYTEISINLSRLGSASTDDYILRVGLIDNWTGLPNNGVWFDYNITTNANWRYSTANGGSRTQTASTTTPSTGWQKLAIRTTGTSAQFFVNGTSIGTQSTNFPNGTGMFPAVGITKAANGATNTTVLVDYYNMVAGWASAR